MPQGRYRLIVTQEFSAAHQLRNYGGPCENIHGHNFAVEAAIEGDRLDPSVEILMDFKELKARVKEVLQELEHRHLNQLPYFQDKNPSSENLAFFIYRNLKERLADRPVRLVSVAVSEKDSSKAVYMED